MGILDFILNLFTNGKKNVSLISKDFSKVYGEKDAFEVGLYNGQTALEGMDVIFNINGRDYTRQTDKDGVARLNINLDVGEYPVAIRFEETDDYNATSASCKVYVNPKSIVTNDLQMRFQDGSRFTCEVFDNNLNTIEGVSVIFGVNGREYTRVTDNKGIAGLNINLNPANYIITTRVAGLKNENTIHVEKAATRMEGTDMNMTAGDGSAYQCAVYDHVGRVAGNVRLTVNGREYIRNCDSTGLYKLNINLEPGTYEIVAEFLGDDYHLHSKVTNKIVINPKPQPKPEPVELHSYITEQGPGKLGQKTPYSCGPHSLMQCIYRLTGIELSESTLMSVCGTTTYGTDHDGLATGLAWFNRKYGYNLKMLWKNKSELSWDEIQSYIDNGALLFHLLYRRSDGHYEVAQDCDSPMNILNSLGDRCGSGYYGYIESRSRAEQQSYINGISQKSVCIITP